MRSASADGDEVERLRAAYARRPAHAGSATWAHVMSIQEREREALRVLERHRLLPLGDRTILDVGCGTGSWIRGLVRLGAQPSRITGIDLLAEDVATARRLVPAGVRLDVGHAARLPYASASFDVVLQSTVFTSVLDPALRRAIAGEMLRVTRPDGLILWYDFHLGNPRNPDVRRVSRREILALFPDCRVQLRRVTLLPPLARWLAPRSWLLASTLARVPWLCSHFLGAITRTPAPAARPARRLTPARAQPGSGGVMAGGAATG